MSQRRSEAARNHLLAKLPAPEFERILPRLEHVSLNLGEAIHESGEHLNYIYFPTTAIAALVYLTEGGTSAGVGMIGNEGVVGMALFLGGETVPHRAVVSSAGEAVRMKVKVLQEEFARTGMFQRRLLRYTQALITQISQSAVCNRFHSIEEQFCRWLLLSSDRLDSNDLIMTHELIANMLGVRRQGVSVAAHHLQENGLISYSRGRIEILDRAGLEAAVCECYRVVRDEYDRLLS